MTKPTPGPWEPLRGHRSLKIRGLRESKPPFRNVINFNGISRATSDEGQANAHLIAAAPEMYEALKALLDPERDMDDAYRIAYAAIAKAEGGA